MLVYVFTLEPIIIRQHIGHRDTNVNFEIHSSQNPIRVYQSTATVLRGNYRAVTIQNLHISIELHRLRRVGVYCYIIQRPYGRRPSRR